MTTRLTRHASKKALPSVIINSKLFSFNNFTDSEFDQTTNYSLLYAEENSVIEEIGHFEYLAGSSEQENTLTTYYTEGTPLETPLYFSTSTSTSDLLKIDDIRISNTLRPEPKDYFAAYQTFDIIKDKPQKQRDLKSSNSFMEFKNKDKECENTDTEIYLPDDLSDFDEKCDEERLESIINVTPSQSPVELEENDREGKIVTFGGEDQFSQQSPLMFSRCSSLGSLSGCEQQSLHDDRSSILSEFSRRTSEAVSPSELPDSPAQLTPHGIKKLGKKKLQPKDKIQSLDSSSVQDVLKNNIFEDNLAVFKEESTPIKFQSVAASSLSSLTIDDDDDGDEHGETNNSKAAVIKSSKIPPNENDQLNTLLDYEKEKVRKKSKENSYFSVDEEKILDEYIRKGIAKVTRQHINDVPSLNLQTSEYNPSSSNQEQLNKTACNDSVDSFDESSELTLEEEKLLDECIRRGIAKVTRQNINDITSLSLRQNFSGLSTIKKCDKDSK